jgi:hypothetical protein
MRTYEVATPKVPDNEPGGTVHFKDPARLMQKPKVGRPEADLSSLTARNVANFGKRTLLAREE